MQWCKSVDDVWPVEGEDEKDEENELLISSDKHDDGDDLVRSSQSDD